jgi:hypothetical protein
MAVPDKAASVIQYRDQGLRNNSGSLAMFAAIRRASSLVSSDWQ